MHAKFTLISISFLLASCSEMAMPKLVTFASHKIEIRQGNLISPEMRERLKPGMTRPQVRSVLGTPLVSDPFHANRWDYVYRLEQNGQLVDNQCLTLYFDGDRLARIDDGDMPPLSAAVSPLTAEPAAGK
ncbi:MAG: outer membrane protein assembly factor BamE [Nitrosomonadales bacterium]|nr:outer membrane protein assembly factor BamE [Nitrosomonadales bacterium]